MNSIRAENIYHAAALNSTPVVKYFVEQKGFPVTKTNSNNQTVAHIAAASCNLEMLKYLLGVDDAALRVIDNFGNSVFQNAVENGALDIVKYLVEEYRADIYQRNERFFSNTAIHLAAEEGQLEVLKYFIEEKHADANVRNEVGEPPAFLAAERKQMNTLKYLAEETNANLTTFDDKKDNILFVCAKIGDLTVPKYLLDERKIVLDVNWRNEAGYTVAFLAARFEKLDLLEYFVGKKHADVNIPDNEGKTPLHVAAMSNNFPIVRYLVLNGANPDLKDDKKKKAAQVAKDPDITTYLNQKLWKRSRRSVPDYHYQVTSIPSEGVLARQMIGEGRPDGFFLRFEASRVNSFLELALACLHYVKGHNYKIFEHESLLSVRQIILNKMDPLVEEVVNDEIRFVNVENSL